MNNSPTNKKKAAAIISLIVFIGVVFMSAIIYNTNTFNIAPEEVGKKEERLQDSIIRDMTTEGVFIDRYEYNITSPNEPGKAAILNYQECFSSLIGYNSKTYGVSGLRSRYKENLFPDKKDAVGDTIKLTIDGTLQEYAYNQLYGHIGSLVIMNAETGEILALASRSDPTVGYDAGDIYNRYSEYNEIPKFWYNRAVYTEDPPGSTFKIVTAASMIENGLEDYEFEDSGIYSKFGCNIHNYDNLAFGQVDLQKGLAKSVNTYFASAGNELGNEKLQVTAERFGYNQNISLDFCELNSNYGREHGVNSNFDTAHCAFGQGNLTTSPLHVTMTMQAVINDGVMLKPYLIDSITTADKGKVVYEGKTEKLFNSMSKTDARKLQEYLHGNAEDEGYKMGEDNGYYAYAKTGTAQTGRFNENGSELYHKYIVCGLKTDDKKYAVCLDFVDLTNPYYDIKQPMYGILEYLNNMG